MKAIFKTGLPTPTEFTPTDTNGALAIPNRLADFFNAGGSNDFSNANWIYLCDIINSVIGISLTWIVRFWAK